MYRNFFESQEVNQFITMDLFSKVKPSLFIARPWDTSFAELYESIKKNLVGKWEINDGPLIVKEDEAQAEREMFISRNKQLYEQIKVAPLVNTQFRYELTFHF